MVLDTINELFRKGKNKALVCGLGVSGKAAVDLLVEKGFNVRAVDENPSEEILSYIDKVQEKGVVVCTGLFKDEEVLKVDFVVASPGIAPSNHILKKAIEEEIPVFSELEAAWQLLDKKPFITIAVTGTNGKSTVVTLLGEIFKRSKRKCLVGGNIGTPLSKLAEEVDNETVLVLEASSFQLYFTQTFSPDISVFLNISSDHMDWHESFEDYVWAKSRIIDLTAEGGVCVLNHEDEIVKKMAERAKSKKVWYSTKDEKIDGSFIGYENGWAVLHDEVGSLKLVERSLFAPIGRHNDSNLLAVSAAAYYAKATLEEISAGVAAFKPLPHRMELVLKLKGIEFIDDSKATNPDAVVKALEGLSLPCVVILGGKNKGNKFTELASKVKEKCLAAVIIGIDTKEIENALSSSDVTFVKVSSMSEATTLAAAIITSYIAFGPEMVSQLVSRKQEPDRFLKDAFESLSTDEKGMVLLSPGCASFDMFINYEHRGEEFKKSVAELVDRINSCER